jgi:hypothetical protein
MRIKLTSIMVDDQDKALKFYTEEPSRHGPVTIAICADTCGNLIQLHHPRALALDFTRASPAGFCDTSS